jgi:hypothetical protein
MKARAQYVPDTARSVALKVGTFRVLSPGGNEQTARTRSKSDDPTAKTLAQLRVDLLAEFPRAMKFRRPRFDR